MKNFKISKNLIKKLDSMLIELAYKYSEIELSVNSDITQKCSCGIGCAGSCSGACGNNNPLGHSYKR